MVAISFTSPVRTSARAVLDRPYRRGLSGRCGAIGGSVVTEEVWGTGEGEE
jgi:hypothetical protein